MATFKTYLFFKGKYSVKNNRENSFIGDIFNLYDPQNSKLKTFYTHEASDISFNYGQLRQHIVVYVTSMYCYLPKINSKIEIFNSEYLSTGYSIFTSANM
jgi:hypothetical protein